MTHYTNCEVVEEHVEKVDEVARLFWSGEEGEAHQRAEDLGWEYIGGGAGRFVFRVAGEQQIGDVTKATHEAPCVVKFATVDPRPGVGGQWQNREEVKQFQDFPDEMKDTGPDEAPVIVPVKDWDKDHLWLSMPEVNPRGGNVQEVLGKLADYGWDCDDMGSRNIGLMHNESIILDYGLDCHEDDTAREEAERLAEMLRDERVKGVHVSDPGAGGQEMDVFFTPPDWVLDTEEPPENSVVTVDRDGLISFMELNIGGYDPQYVDAGDPTVDDAAEAVGEAITDEWFDAEVLQRVVDMGGLATAEFSISHVDDGWPPLIAKKVMITAFDAAHKEMPGGEQHPLPSSAATSAAIEAEAEMEEAVDEEVEG